jgi:hypothetical protein
MVMAQTKPGTKTNEDQKRAKPFQQIGHQPIGEEARRAKDSQRVSPEATTKVNSYLRTGDISRIPEAQQAGNSNVTDEIKNNTEQAREEVVRRVRHRPPGYVPKCRADKKTLATYVTDDVHEAFKAIAQLNGTTSDALLRDMVTAVVEQYQKPGQVQEAMAESVERYQGTLSKAALRLVGGVNPK